MAALDGCVLIQLAPVDCVDPIRCSGGIQSIASNKQVVVQIKGHIRLAGSWSLETVQGQFLWMGDGTKGSASFGNNWGN